MSSRRTTADSDEYGLGLPLVRLIDDGLPPAAPGFDGRYPYTLDALGLAHREIDSPVEWSDFENRHFTDMVAIDDYLTSLPQSEISVPEACAFLEPYLLELGYEGAELDIACGEAWENITKWVQEERTASSAFPPPGFLEGSLYRDWLYHGSNAADLHELRPNQGGEYGIFLSPNHRYARQYGTHLYKVFVNVQNPLFVEGKHEISPRDLTRTDIQQIQADGYDAIVSGAQGADIASAHEVVVFDPHQVFVVTSDRQASLENHMKTKLPNTITRNGHTYRLADDLDTYSNNVGLMLRYLTEAQAIADEDMDAFREAILALDPNDPNVGEKAHDVVSDLGTLRDKLLGVIENAPEY